LLYFFPHITPQRKLLSGDGAATSNKQFPTYFTPFSLT
jgi:hypothetical protein